MKKIQIILSLSVLMALFASCSTKVDLYAGYKDIPIVYGLLDAMVDTNYIKIVRAFSGSEEATVNAAEIALIADSCNYPGKLDAHIIEYADRYGTGQFELSGRIITLDTMTIHNKEIGEFYAPNQKIYWTAEPFNVNSGKTRYKYRLEIFKGNDTVTSETAMVGGENFRILTAQAAFMDVENKHGEFNFVPADNAAIYYLKIKFNYHEIKNGQETLKSVGYEFPAMRADNLIIDGGKVTVDYSQNLLFNLLREAIGGDTIHNPNNPEVERYFDETPFDIMIAAGGDELFNYIQVNSVTGYSQTVPDYTNINGGFGVFSSRINMVKSISLSNRAMIDIYAKESWGFKQQ